MTAKHITTNSVAKCNMIRTVSSDCNSIVNEFKTGDKFLKH